jgi:hypothetical protein
MTVKDDLHHLVDELDDVAAPKALMLLLQNLELPGEPLEAEIDAEYERAYREHPISEAEPRVLDAFTRISVRTVYREPGSHG